MHDSGQSLTENLKFEVEGSSLRVVQINSRFGSEMWGQGVGWRGGLGLRIVEGWFVCLMQESREVLPNSRHREPLSQRQCGHDASFAHHGKFL